MRLSFLVLVSMIVVHTGIAQNRIAEKLDELLTAYTNVNLFNGSVLIVQNGRVLVDKGYGFSNIREHTRNTVDSKFQIYSITKSMTATVILKLAEEHRLSLEDRLSKYFPSLPMGDSITVKHLLTHTSGLYCYNNDFSMPVTSEREMVEFLRKMPLDFSPGTEWKYCNTGYFLLGFIIQKATGMSYERAVEKYIFAPLHMNHSGFDYPALTDKHKTTGYTMLYNDTSATAPIYDPHELFAAGGIYSTTRDLYRYHKAMQANAIITKKSADQAYTPFKKNYGYGWFIDSVAGKRVISHSGGASGFRSYLIRIAEDNTVVILLCNSENSDVSTVKKKILNVLFNQPYIIPRQIVISKDRIAQFQGAYSFTPEMTIYVSAENGRLTARPSRQNATLLLAETETRFYVDEINGYLDFSRGGTGGFDTLVLTQDGQRYTGFRIHPSWSLVGSATPNGWNGPDMPLNQDTTKKGVWAVNDVRLSDGEIKFRMNNDWTFQYGVDRKTSTLVSGGDNIRIAAGRYDIMLDLTNPAAPAYKITRRE